MGSFSADVGAWVRKSQNRMDAVFRLATQNLFLQATGLTPVDTGFAKASFVVSLNNFNIRSTNNPTVAATRGAAGSILYEYNEHEIELSIASAVAGRDTIYGAWGANYIVHIEYGANGREGVGMARLSAQNWQNHVDDAVRQAKARVKG